MSLRSVTFSNAGANAARRCNAPGPAGGSRSAGCGSGLIGNASLGERMSYSHVFARSVRPVEAIRAGPVFGVDQHSRD